MSNRRDSNCSSQGATSEPLVLAEDSLVGIVNQFGDFEENSEQERLMAIMLRFASHFFRKNFSEQNMRRIVVAIEAARQTLDKAYTKLTEQKKHELEETLILHLHEYDRLLRTTSIPFALIRTEVDVLVRANQSFCDIVGIPFHVSPGHRQIKAFDLFTEESAVNLIEKIALLMISTPYGSLCTFLDIYKTYPATKNTEFIRCMVCIKIAWDNNQIPLLISLTVIPHSLDDC